MTIVNFITKQLILNQSCQYVLKETVCHNQQVVIHIISIPGDNQKWVYIRWIKFYLQLMIGLELLKWKLICLHCISLSIRQIILVYKNKIVIKNTQTNKGYHKTKI